MQVDVLDFDYDTTKIAELESRINASLDHHEADDIEFVRWQDDLLVFLVTEE
jgi:hypothetical protein